MTPKTLPGRITKVEADIEAVNNKVEGFQEYCKETQIRYNRVAEKLANRVDNFLNHEVTALKKSIAAIQKTKRAPWGPKEWATVISTVIMSAASIIVVMVQLFG